MAAASSAKAIIAGVAAGDLSKLKTALSRHSGPIPAQAMLKCGLQAWLPGARLLVARGGDLNAPFKNYRPPFMR